jgi:nucleotide-binding universal stress UspA family protein
MNATATSSAPRASVRALRPQQEPAEAMAPIVAAVDASPDSRAVIDAAVRLAAELVAPLVFVYVRRGPAAFLGTPVYQRRLTKAIAKASRVLDRALRDAARADVDAEGEILEGRPRKRILEFARDRGARSIVVGAHHRRLGRSVSCAVARAADGPVVVARRAGRELGGQSV